MNADKYLYSRWILERNKLELDGRLDIIYGASIYYLSLCLEFIRKANFLCLGHIYQGKLTVIAILD